jgi:hypothetical protein
VRSGLVGYYNLSAGTGNAPERGESLESLGQGSEVSILFREDRRSGKLIYYDLTSGPFGRWRQGAGAVEITCTRLPPTEV